MDESAHPNKAPSQPPTPEVAELLKMLDAQTAARRQRRAPADNPFQTSTFRYGGLVAIVIFAFGSLGLLEWLLSEIPKPVHTTLTVAPAPSGAAASGSKATATAKGSPSAGN